MGTQGIYSVMRKTDDNLTLEAIIDITESFQVEKDRKTIWAKARVGLGENVGMTVLMHLGPGFNE